MNAISIAVGNLQVPRPGRAGANDHRVVVGTQLIYIEIPAYVSVGNERLKRERLSFNLCGTARKTFNTHDTLVSHQVDTTLHDALIELHAILT